MLNGLDLFSGIGGGALALAGYVRIVAYCEIERAAQAMLLTRMAAGDIPTAPIWDDVSTLRGSDIPHRIDIITGGFPCQDISVAGNGAGLAGKRSGLFYEIARLCGELKPRFIFLENVPAITIRGGTEVVRTLAAMGYDCRWCILPATSVGAPCRRERWFLLAKYHPKPVGYGLQRGEPNETRRPPPPIQTLVFRDVQQNNWRLCPLPNVYRVGFRLPTRVDRIRGLGNAWVPAQARKAFEVLMGLKE